MKPLMSERMWNDPYTRDLYFSGMLEEIVDAQEAYYHAPLWSVAGPPAVR